MKALHNHCDVTQLLYMHSYLFASDACIHTHTHTVGKGLFILCVCVCVCVYVICLTLSHSQHMHSIFLPMMLAYTHTVGKGLFILCVCILSHTFTLTTWSPHPASVQQIKKGAPTSNTAPTRSYTSPPSPAKTHRIRSKCDDWKLWSMPHTKSTKPPACWALCRPLVQFYPHFTPPPPLSPSSTHTRMGCLSYFYFSWNIRRVETYVGLTRTPDTYRVCMVFLAGKSPNIQPYTVHIYTVLASQHIPALLHWVA